MSRSAVGRDGSVWLPLVLALRAGVALVCALLLLSSDGEAPSARLQQPDPVVAGQGDSTPDAPERPLALQPVASSPGAVEILTRAPGEPARQAEASLLAVQLEGQVTDQQGQAVADARIEVAVSGALQEHTVVADADGRFRLATDVRSNAALTLVVSRAGYGQHTSQRRFTTGGLHALGNLVLPSAGELRGRVVDGQGWPVRDAELQLISSGSFSAALMTELAGRSCAFVTTGSDGTFVIGELSPGGYRLRVTAPQFCWSEHGDPIAILAGASLDIGTIRLEPGATIIGTVSDLQGRPVPQARISLPGQEDFAEEGTSDENGRFEVGHVPLGSVLLKVESDLHLTWTEVVPEQDLGAVQVVLGERIELMLRVAALATGRPVSSYAARPRRVGEVGSPAPVLAAGQPILERSGQLAQRPDGEAAIAIDHEGWWVVDLMAPGFVSMSSEPVLVRADNDRHELQLLLLESLPVGGRVTAAADDLPVAGAAVTLWSLVGDGSLGGEPSGRADRTLLAGSRTDPQGEFSFDGFGPGLYVIKVRSRHHAQYWSRPFNPSTLNLELDFELLARAGLQGRVRGEDRAAGQCMVVALPAERGVAAAFDVLIVPVAQDGSYVAENLQPGAVIVRAFQGDARLFIDQIIKNAPPADLFLAPGEQRRLDLRLTPNSFGSLAGSVSVNGQAALGFAVALQPPDGEGGVRRRLSRVDHQGRFRIVDVLPGSYRVMVYSEGEGLLLYEAMLAISRDEQSDFSIDLSTGRASGRIVSEYGETLSDLSGQLRLGPGLGGYPGTLGAEDNSARSLIEAGVFSVRHLPQGVSRLDLLIEGREARTIELRVIADQDNLLELLDQPATVGEARP